MTAGRDPRRRRRLQELPRADVAGCGAARHFARETFEAFTAALEARREDHGLRRRAAGVHQGVLGLSRSAGHRRAYRERPRDAGAVRRAFEAVERAYGVDRHIIAAIWGIETKYGAVAGDRPVIRSTATLACVGRRQAYFKDEFLSALEILQRGDIQPDQLKGSWAGRLRPDAVHADRVQALRGRLRRRRPARCGRLGAGRDRLDRQPSEEGRLGRRARPGATKWCCRRASTSCWPIRAQAMTHRRMGSGSACARPDGTAVPAPERPGLSVGARRARAALAS